MPDDQTRLSAASDIPADDLSALLRRYGLRAVSGCELAANGIENRNYFISARGPGSAPSADYVLTLLERPSNSGGGAYVSLLDCCQTAGLPVPAIVRNRAGHAFEQLHNKQVLLSERLYGEHVLRPTAEQCLAIGQFLARYHDATAKLAAQLPDYPRAQTWLQQSLAQIRQWAQGPDWQQAQQAVTHSCAVLAQATVQALPVSAIHGDLFRDNALFNAAELTGVLDFHHAARGYCLFDLAVVANDWCSEPGGQLNAERTLMLLRGYHQRRPLPQSTLALFPAFTLYAGVVFYLSRAVSLATRNTGGGTGRFKDPGEFAAIVAQRQAQPFQPTQQLL